jgi:hypothetical protein
MTAKEMMETLQGAAPDSDVLVNGSQIELDEMPYGEPVKFRTCDAEKEAT